MVHPHRIGAELFPRLVVADGVALRELFQLRTKEWPQPLMHGEHGTCGLFSDLAQTEDLGADYELSSDVAFELIPTALTIVLEHAGAPLSECAFQLLHELVRISETTELPPALHEHWKTLRTMSHGSVWTRDCWQEIETWYRLRSKSTDSA